MKTPFITENYFRCRLLIWVVAGGLAHYAWSADLDPILRGAWTGNWVPRTLAVEVQDRYAYAGTERGLWVVDVTNPANP